MKDRFSDTANLYATYRPQYPGSLFRFITSHLASKEEAWDAGTGNGQVAVALSGFFKNVYASDISPKQLEHAVQKENIHYQVHPAEHTPYANAQFDLITVAQAIHWFDFNAFFKEVNRTLKPGGLLAVWGYGLIKAPGKLNDIIAEFYESKMSYWDGERRHIDEAYANIQFPFPLIPTPAFHIEVQWNISHLAGYISSWSCMKRMNSTHGNVLEVLVEKLRFHWPTPATVSFTFPVFMKLGRK